MGTSQLYRKERHGEVGGEELSSLDDEYATINPRRRRLSWPTPARKNLAVAYLEKGGQ
jgi:hypothetical protein